MVLGVLIADNGIHLRLGVASGGFLMTDSIWPIVSTLAGVAKGHQEQAEVLRGCNGN